MTTVRSTIAALAGAALLLSAQAAAAAAPGAYLAARGADAAGDAASAAQFYSEALLSDPDDPALLEAATLNLVAAGRIADGVRTAKRLAAQEPDSRVARLALVSDAFSRGDFAEAREMLERHPEGFMPLMRALLQGWAAHGAGDREAAEAAFTGMTEPPIFKVFGDYHLGLMRAAAGDSEGALAGFEAAQAGVAAPTSRLSLAHGATLERLGRKDEAREVYAAAMERPRLGDPIIEDQIRRLEAGGAPPVLVETAAEGAAEAMFGVASALGADAGRRFALAHARLAGFLRPDLAPVQLLTAELLEADEQLDEALAAYGAIAGEDPLWSRAQIGRARALGGLGRDDAAIEALRALATQRPGSIDAHVALGDRLRAADRFEDAAEAYSQAISLAETAGDADWVLYYQRGIAYERAKRWPEAEADFLKALDLEPDQPLVLNYLGYTWVDRGENLVRAQDMIERAVDARPDDGYITDSLGWVHYKLGNYDKAVTWLERAVELAPVDPVINDHLGDALWRVGRRLEAQFQWKRARSLEPDAETLGRIKRKLAEGLDAVLENEAEDAGRTVSGDGR